MSLAIFGDSIAVGVASVLKAAVVVAHVGWPTPTIYHEIPASIPEDTIIISAGSNDAMSPQLSSYLFMLREKLGHKKVIWILPHNARAAKLVAQEAAQHGDRTIAFHAGHDGIHPASYGALAEGLRELI